MKIPYNRVHANGEILLAARGGKIHGFSLLDGSHVSTWKHPDLVTKSQSDEKGSADAVDAPVNVAANTADGTASNGDGPPAKRQRVDNGDHVEPSHKGEELVPTADSLAAENRDLANGKGKDEGGDEAKPGPKGKKKGKKDKPDNQVSRAPERPIITQLTSTIDGHHVVAVSGHDKTIWVFEHDGQGGLTRISSRTMPKRPSAIAVSADSQIISADKFGDVYALPLIPTPLSPLSANPRHPASNHLAKPAALAANPLVVHSKRNLEALEHQRKQLELKNQQNADPVKEGPDFELTLLLGHVSMLTSLALGESNGRRYVLSGDRDEHIRVSRYIPQSHVIEGFCLGHKEFVSELLIPPSRGEILISGGGEEDLFIWDWTICKLLSRKSIMDLARKIAPDTTKLAVSGLFSLVYPSESGDLTYILAICESIQAIFSWNLTPDNNLNHPSVIQLPGAPLHLSTITSQAAPPKLVVATDPGETSVKSLHTMALTLDNGRLCVDTQTTFQDEALEADEADWSESKIRQLLYTVESLRKQAVSAEDDGIADVEAGARAAADGIETADR